jgi:hypothetical protein
MLIYLYGHNEQQSTVLDQHAGLSSFSPSIVNYDVEDIRSGGFYSCPSEIMVPVHTAKKTINRLLLKSDQYIY